MKHYDQVNADPFFSVLLMFSFAVNKGFSKSLPDTSTGKGGIFPSAYNFTAVPADERAILHWSVQQQNSLDFVIEHSVDGNAFYPLDTIEAETGRNAVPGYTYTHTGAGYNLINYYRLKQVNKAGNASYSHIRVVRFADKKAGIVQATPNPVTDALQVTVLTNDIRIVIKNADNRTIYRKKLHPGRHKVNTSNWTAGIYQVKVYEDGRLAETTPVFKF